jgi:hypothetical protein
MAPTALNTYIWTFRCASFTLNASVQRGHDDVEFTLIAYATGSELSIANEKECICKIVRTTWPLLTMYIINNQQAYCELAAYVGDQTTFDNVLQSVDKYDRDALQKFIDEQKCMVALPVVALPIQPHARADKYKMHTFQFLIGEDKLDALVGRGMEVYKCRSLEFDLRTPLVNNVGTVKANIRSIVARTWVGATGCLTNNQQAYCELAAFVSDQTTFDAVLYSVDKYDRDALQKFIAMHACAVALPHIHTFDFECKCASSSYVRVYIGGAKPVYTYNNTNHEQECPVTQTCLNIIAKKAIRPSHAPTCNDTWMRLVAVIGDQACFDVIENWVVTYDYDALKDFVAQHNLTVKLPARTCYHTFTFDCVQGGPLVEIVLGRRSDVTFIHSMKRLSGDVANMSMKCVAEIITGTFIPATYKRQHASVQTWANIAAFTNNVKTYKSVTEWSPGAVDQELLDFARKHECTQIVEYMTPRNKEVTCTIGAYTITWHMTKQQDQLTKSAVVTGSLQESDFAIVASILARATDRIKPIHVATGPYADLISAAYKQIDEFSQA